MAYHIHSASGVDVVDSIPEDDGSHHTYGRSCIHSGAVAQVDNNNQLVRFLPLRCRQVLQ
jgi:hypothetical protein